jgi:hypothetical protein
MALLSGRALAENEEATMSKISTAAATELAKLINAKETAGIMQTSAIESGDWAQARHWRFRGYSITIALFDDFGIRLPGYDDAVEAVKVDLAA